MKYYISEDELNSLIQELYNAIVDADEVDGELLPADKIREIVMDFVHTDEDQS